MANAPPSSQADWLAEYPPPRSLPLDQEAVRIYECAYHIGLETEEAGAPCISFSTVIAALLKGDDEASKWFAETAKALGPAEELVFKDKKIDAASIARAATERGKPSSVRLSTDKQLLTQSARSVMENAEAWAGRVGGSDIGVRHLVAAYVLNPPPAHRSQMLAWKFQSSGWRDEFFRWVAKRYTWETWSDTTHRPAPTRAVPTFEQQSVKGESLAFPGDEVAMKVLEKAAEFHRRTKDQWLRLQTVFFAFVETGRDDDEVRRALGPIWDAIAVVEAKYDEARDAFLSEEGSAKPQRKFSDLDISPRVLNALETARELAVATRALRGPGGGEVSVGADHLTAALLSRRVDGDETLTSFGLEPQALRLSLISDIGEHDASIDIWREVLGEEEVITTGRPVDLNSDEPEAVIRLDEQWTNDPLAIRRDVDSFASLLASRSLEPPLSIGLFGPWGSGKTTFLKRLRRAVTARAAESAAVVAGAPPSPFVSNVVHVDFNAWHFSEDALISSIVDAILRALSAHIKDDVKIAGSAWAEQKRRALESTKRKVEAAAAVESAAREAAVAAEQRLTDSRKTASEHMTRMEGVVQAVWKQLRATVLASPVVKKSGVMDAIGESVKSADELRDRVASARARPARMLSDLGWGGTLIFAALVLVLPPVVGWVVGKGLSIGQVGQLLSSVTAVLTVVAVWTRTAARAVAKVDGVLADVANEYDKRLAADNGVKDAQAQFDAAQASVETATVGLQAARQELARAEADVANAALPAQMLKLVSSRIDDRSYGKELTTLSLARADLEALSVLLRDQRTAAESVAGARTVDRVILYIDDLDRCKPEDVVRVLQLVHMLLAFELFVVVVAVDARWVEQALRSKYPWLSADDVPGDGGSAEGEKADDGQEELEAARVSPQDYLEKIFQISFWLEPMTASRAARYLGSLVRAPYRGSGPVVRPDAATGKDSAAESLASQTEAVGIAGIELDYMRALAAYVGSSPRRVKRLVNAYRLIKARMSNSQLDTFLTDRKSDGDGLRSGPYQIVIGLLVIGTGAPSSASQIMKELAEADPRDTYLEVVERLRTRNHPDWSVAAQVIETLMRTQKAADVSELRGWARKVGRFLLHSPTIDLRVSLSAVAAAVPEAVPELVTSNGVV